MIIQPRRFRARKTYTKAKGLDQVTSVTSSTLSAPKIGRLPFELGDCNEFGFDFIAHVSGSRNITAEPKNGNEASPIRSSSNHIFDAKRPSFCSSLSAKTSHPIRTADSQTTSRRSKRCTSPFFGSPNIRTGRGLNFRSPLNETRICEAEQVFHSYASASSSSYHTSNSRPATKSSIPRNSGQPLPHPASPGPFYLPLNARCSNFPPSPASSSRICLRSDDIFPFFPHTMDSLQLQIPATYPITRPPSPLSDLEADIPVNQLFFDSTIERATDDALRMPAVYPVSRPASPLFDPELGLPVAIESAGPSWLSLLVNFRW